MIHYKEHLNLVTWNHQNLIQAVFNINIPILDKPDWVRPNSILSQIKTSKKYNFSFFDQVNNII